MRKRPRKQRPRSRKTLYQAGPFGDYFDKRKCSPEKVNEILRYLDAKYPDRAFNLSEAAGYAFEYGQELGEYIYKGPVKEEDDIW